MFQHIVDAITGFVGQNNNPLGLSILAACALLEYVFPPFPGDTVTLFGAFLVVRYSWSLPLVFSSVMIGSAVGAMIDYAIGAVVGRRYRQGKVVQNERTRAQVERVLAAFRRYGPAYVTINRFLPGIRAVIFLAAGMAGLKPRWVLLFAMVSAALWNAMILALGYMLGAQWDRILAVVQAYGQLVYLALGIGAIVLLARWYWRRCAGQ